MMPGRGLNLAIIGAGRIGRIHAQNLATHITGARLTAVADVNAAAAQEVATRWNVPRVSVDYCELLADATVDAVVICSATDTHAQIIEAAAARRKHVFCEKPIALDHERIVPVLNAVARAGVKLQVGFNRRFDPSFVKVREVVASGKIGLPHIVRITSRDPAPPPLHYVRVSGGLLLDMTTHDFDMVRFLTGSEAADLYALGDALIDPEIGRAGDIDTCVTTMRLRTGALAVIDNSRQAVYGYDQRVEVFGSMGMVTVTNRTPDGHVYVDAAGAHSAKPEHFFLERYRESYIAEMQDFVDCVLNDRTPSVTGKDGLVSVIMATAALKSLREQRRVRLDEIASPD